MTLLLFAGQYTVNSNQNEVNLISTDAQSTILEMTLGHFEREAVRINNDTYWALSLKKEGFSMETGMPQLPYVTRSIIIPGMAKMAFNVLESEYTDIVMPIIPSKGSFTRDIDPNTVAWIFDPFYQSDGFYPAELARLSEPFIIRDYRGITVHFQPFVYFPATQTLRVYTRLKLSVNNIGTDNYNTMSAAKTSASAWFEGIYKGMFLNYNQAKYPVLDEFGRMLIVKNSMFNASLQPFIDWKRQKGFVVDVVDITTAGPTANQLKTYIQNQYDMNTDLAFVQIIGDHAQVPSLSSGGGASDPSFGLLAGSDSYPDIFVGRFSAENVAELETQITRTLNYELAMQTGNDWLAKGMGIASNEGGGGSGDLGESDQVHMEYIRTDLLGYGYTTVDQVYQAQGATIAQVSNGANAGRGFINYCGHGSNTSWSTTGFSNTNVNQLTNDNKLPFIVSVACVNGNFANLTCFAEAWVRARDSVTGNPRGAVVFYGSSINQLWNPPMRAQDEIVDLMIAHQKNTIGGLFFNGSSKMIEVYGTDGSNMYKTWHIFGDASLQVRTTEPQPMTAQYMSVLFLGMTSLTVQTNPGAWVTLSSNGTVYGTAFADATGNAVVNLTTIPTEPMNLTITITCFNKITHVSTIQVLPSSGPYILVNTPIISDTNNNQADFGESVFMDIPLNNVGSDAATNVSVIISSTDQYITITDNTENYGIINANATSTSTNGFAVQVANFIPDQHNAAIHVSVYLNSVLSWEYNTHIILNAPAFTAGAVSVNDISGNNNGRIDAGEVVSITIPVTNSGHADVSNVYFSLLITNQIYHIINPVLNSFPLIPAGETAQVIFDVIFSSQVPVGTVAQFMIMGVSGDYHIIHNFSQTIGLVIEDFESGSLTAFPWTFPGQPWTLDNSTFHSGTSSVKSATITHNQSTSMTVQMDVSVAGNISFWKKVSSEQSYDFLKFYINNTIHNQWSGNLDWSQETFTVPAGLATFKWEYTKDNIVSSGSDCAWIDDIIFPGTGGITGTPSISVSSTSLDFGAHIDSEFETMTFTITNEGDATMIGTVMGTPLFQVKQASETNYHNFCSFVIPAGLTMNFSVKFIPLAEGTYNAVLTINSDDPDNPVIEIAVTAVVLPISNEDNLSAIVTALKGNYPNPFSPETTILYSVKGEFKVTIEVYNILGQKVKTLVSDKVKSGNHSIKWNGKDEAGRSVGSGIYFYRMTAGKYRATAKMMLMK